MRSVLLKLKISVSVSFNLNSNDFAPQNSKTAGYTDLIRSLAESVNEYTGEKP
jgi:hypothetical protein